jgi:hypothetical protein
VNFPCTLFSFLLLLLLTLVEIFSTLFITQRKTKILFPLIFFRLTNLWFRVTERRHHRLISHTVVRYFKNRIWKENCSSSKCWITFLRFPRTSMRSLFFFFLSNGCVARLCLRAARDVAFVAVGGRILVIFTSASRIRRVDYLAASSWKSSLCNS